MGEVRTRSQKLSEGAWKAVSAHTPTTEYKTRARSFPALIHRAGLCQALAYQAAKGPKEYATDLETVFKIVDASPGSFALSERARTASVTEYMTLTRQVMEAAQWIKRSVDALAPEEDGHAAD